MYRVRQLAVFRNPRIILPVFQLAIRIVHAFGGDDSLTWLLREKLIFVRRLHGVESTR